MTKPVTPWTEADYIRAGLARLSLRLSRKALLILTREAAKLKMSRAALLERLILEYRNHKHNGVST